MSHSGYLHLYFGFQNVSFEVGLSHTKLRHYEPYETRYGKRVVIAYANNKGSGEPAMLFAHVSYRTRENLSQKKKKKKNDM